MIPLRRALIVKEHGELTYPEGTACAEVLVAGEKGGLQARRLFQAFGIGVRLQVPDVRAQGLEGVSRLDLDRLQGRVDLGRGLARAARRRLHHRARASRRTCSPAASLAYLVLIPAIKLFGSGLDHADLRRDQAHRRHEPERDRAQLRVLHRRRRGRDGRASSRCSGRLPDDHLGVPLRLPGPARQPAATPTARLRTDAGPAGLGRRWWARSRWRCCSRPCPELAVNLLGAILIVVFGFFFVVVSSRITGEIGSARTRSRA